MCKNIILVGMPGCGKTTLGKMLSEALNTEFYDVDHCIEIREKESINEIFKKGEDFFRDIESKVLEEVCKNKAAVISTGGGVIKRRENIQSIRNNGIVFFIDRPIENIVKDVKIDNRPLLKDGKDKVYQLFKERYQLYLNICHYRIDNSGNIQRTLEKILKTLGEESEK